MEEMYSKIQKLQTVVREVIWSIRRQDYLYASRKIESILDELSVVLSTAVENIPLDMDSIQEMLNNLVVTQESADYILLADLYELQLLPFLESIQSMLQKDSTPPWEYETFTKNLQWIKKWNPDIENQLFGCASSEDVWKRQVESVLNKGYVVEYTQNGRITMSALDGETRYYYHSNTDVAFEAREVAQMWFSENVYDYVIYGLGLGYHVKSLAQMYEMVEVVVYESNPDVMFLALNYSDMYTWDEEKIQVYYQENLHSALKEIQRENKELVIHFPSLRGMKKGIQKEVLRDYFYQYASMKVEVPMLCGNVIRNEKVPSQSAWDLQKEWKDKRVYIIAAGPSLDKNISLLKNREKDSVLLATGTVLRKMLALDIRPDYVIIIDGGKGTYKQIQEIEDCMVPLIYLSSVNFRILKDYQGKKYRLYQEGLPLAEEKAKEKGEKLVQTGGSVSTTALDFALQCKPKDVVFLGLDLAYTSGKSHCGNTKQERSVGKEDLIDIEDVYGKTVQTGRNLNTYRKWIEKRLEKETTPVIDATEGGAKIKGMVIKLLKDIL